MRYVVIYLFNGICILLFKYMFMKFINFVYIGCLMLKKLKKIIFIEMVNFFFYDNYLIKFINGFFFNLIDGYIFKIRGI